MSLVNVKKCYFTIIDIGDSSEETTNREKSVGLADVYSAQESKTWLKASIGLKHYKICMFATVVILNDIAWNKSHFILTYCFCLFR